MPKAGGGPWTLRAAADVVDCSESAAASSGAARMAWENLATVLTRATTDATRGGGAGAPGGARP